ncbi:MAG: hypothetical protein ACOZAR_03350 [Patescibacteria group bacterium]
MAQINKKQEVLATRPIDEEYDPNQVFEWESYEFEYHEKGKNWVWGLVGVVVLMSVLFAVLKNWLGIGIVVLLAIVVYQYAFKKPDKIHFVLTKDGLLVGDKMYAFKELKQFWVTHEGMLYIDTKQYIPPRLSSMLSSVDVEAMVKFLEYNVPKVDRKTADSGDQLSKWLKL